MSTLTELGDYTETHIAGLVQGGNAGNLFLGSRPDSPDEMVCIYQYPGGGAEYNQNSYNPEFERVQIQVVARAVRYERAELLCTQVWILLAPITNAVIGGTKYRSIRPNHSPATMGRDTNDRLLVFFNASIEKEVSLVA